MQTMLQKAAAGQKKAMEYLYNSTKQKVFYVSKLLLRDESQAESAVIWVYRFGWSEIQTLGIESEEDFLKFAMQRAVGYCKKRVLKKNPKAFHVPSNRNFSIQQLTNAEKESKSIEELVLSQFSDLQRFIWVLDVVAKYEKKELSKVVNIKQDTLELALEMHQKNMVSILRNAGIESDVTYADIMTEFYEKEQSCVVPQRVDDEVEKVIDIIVEPIEKKKRKQWKFIFSVIALVCILMLGAGVFGSSDDVESAEGTGNDVETENTEFSESVEVNADYYADIVIENYGTITVALDASAAPETVANFVSLAESGFYDGLTFHRIEENFMMQGGDPEGDGTGGSEETITGEFSDNGFENPLSHIRGAISMARLEDYDSASSQFFIVHEDSTFLDGFYAAFGYVTEGIEIVDEICTSAEPIDDNGMIASEKQPVITSITIRDTE